MFHSELMLKVEEEEKKLEAAIGEIEKQRMDVRHQLQELEQKSKNFEELEERCSFSSPVY